jgi:hypothetical protein
MTEANEMASAAVNAAADAGVEAVVEAGADSALLERLRAKGARLDVPLVRALEREGRARDALALCESVTRDRRDPGAAAREEAVALARTGRRLARSLR